MITNAIGSIAIHRVKSVDWWTARDSGSSSTATGSRRGSKTEKFYDD